MVDLFKRLTRAIRSWSIFFKDRKDRKIEFPTLIKTEPDAVGAYTTEYVGMASGPNTCKQKPDIYLCIRSCRERLGFYAEIQVIFGTVYLGGKKLWVALWRMAANSLAKCLPVKPKQTL